MRPVFDPGANGMSLTITESDLKRFAPRANAEYAAALLGGIEMLREAGILENEYRLCHFMGQCGAETGGFTVVRESLMYMTAKRLREVWPARFRNKSDLELKPLIKNPIALGDAVYGGRMGNTFPADGYNFRGGGFLQTTGRAAVTRYCKACDIPFRADVLDDIHVTLRFAIYEWVESKCNEWADENDLTKVSKAINTGSAFGNTKPVGMTSRQEWFAKAWGIWGDKGKPDRVKTPISPAKVATVGTAAGGGVVATKEVVVPAFQTAKPALEVASNAVSKAKEAQVLVTEAKGIAKFAAADPLWIVGAGVLFALVLFAPKLLGKG